VPDRDRLAARPNRALDVRRVSIKCRPLPTLAPEETHRPVAEVLAIGRKQRHRRAVALLP
jgi:hypothetical protein